MKTRLENNIGICCNITDKIPYSFEYGSRVMQWSGAGIDRNGEGEKGREESRRIVLRQFGRWLHIFPK